MILVAAGAAALFAAAAASHLVVRTRRPIAAWYDRVAVDKAVAREQARTCRPPLAIDELGYPLSEAKAALASARALPPAAALRAELAVLRTAVAYPTCRPTLVEVSSAAAMIMMAGEALRATWSTAELTAAERAAAAAELAAIEAAEPAIERIIEVETDWALAGLAPALRGEPAPPMWQYSQQEAATIVREVLQTRARLRAACPDGTALAACADALADRPDLGTYTLVLRRYVAAVARLDALRADLR